MTAFLDSNILLYAIGSDPEKADRAEALLREGGIISIQVLNEVANVCLRKRGLAFDRVDAVLTLFRGMLTVVSVTLETQDAAMALVARHRLSVWDANLLAAALAAGCMIFWSEDLHDGLVIDGRLTIRNPFA